MALQAGLITVPHSWESYKAYFPHYYERDWADFQNLRLRARNGDFGPLMQAKELVYVEPAQFGAQIPPGYPGPGQVIPGTSPATPPEPMAILDWMI